jgi:hypothetical protein
MRVRSKKPGAAAKETEKESHLTPPHTPGLRA